MSLSVKILTCDGLCRSCYENRIRANKGAPSHYNIDAIIDTLKREMTKTTSKNPPTIHGGEPLTINIKDLEKLLAVIFEKYNRTSIQTNGIAMTSEHIELFKKYNTSVGVSIDGDTAELNLGRWNAKTLDRQYVQKMTDKVLENIRLCKEKGLNVSVITVLRKYNASPRKLPELVNFLKRLAFEYDVFWVRTNEGIVYEDSFRQEEELTTKELGLAYIVLASVCFSNSKFMWSPYRDVVDAMLGSKNVVCVMTECDIWHTNAEEPIDAVGNVGNCLKGGGAIDGFQVLRADQETKERYRALKQISVSEGGCGGCRWWNICKGGCPGAGAGNDWRAKTRFCDAWMRLFVFVENYIKGLMPNIITAADGADSVAASMANVIRGSSYRAEVCIAPCGNIQNREIIKDRPNYTDRHGDIPHGDHTDYQRRNTT